VEYFSLLYASQLFLPEDAGAVIDFWTAELQRTQHFLIKHAAFHEHHHEDGTVYDEKFFSAEGSYSRLAARSSEGKNTSIMCSKPYQTTCQSTARHSEREYVA